MAPPAVARPPRARCARPGRGADPDRTWDVSLSAGLALRGRVLRGDEGVGSVVVVAEATAVPGLDGWTGRAFADEEGRFTIPDCPRGRVLVVTLDTADGSAPRLADVDPRAGEVELRSPE